MDNARHPLFSTQVSHVSAFKRLCIAFDLKQKPDKTPYPLASPCFYPFQTHFVVYCLPRTELKVLYFLVLSGHFHTALAQYYLTFFEEIKVQKIMGTEPRKVGHYSNHYPAVRLFIASSVWCHELYFLGSRVALCQQKMSNGLILNYFGFGPAIWLGTCVRWLCSEYR